MRKFGFLYCTFFIWNLLEANGQPSRLDTLRLNLDTVSTDEGKMKLLNALSYELCYVNADSAITLAERALTLARTLENQKQQADALNNLGVANHIRGNYDKAISYYKSCLVLRREAVDSAGIAGLQNNMASIYAIQGNYPLALENYQQSLDIKLKLGNDRGAANSLNNIGNIYYYQQNFKRSLEYYQRSLAIERKIGNAMGQGRSLANIGLVYLEDNQPEEALEHYLKAYAKVDSLNLECQKMYSADGLGQTYFVLNDFSKAHRYLDEAYSEAVKCNDPVIISSSLETLGRISLAYNQNSLAEKRFLESFEVATENDIKKSMKDVSWVLYEFYKKKNDIGRALKFLEINKSVSDSVLNQDLTEKLTSMEMNFRFNAERDSIQFAREREVFYYDSEIKKRQLVQIATFAGLTIAVVVAFVIFRFYKLKQKANRQLSEKNEIISKSLGEKEVMLREIHHRVKNNLQIISSLLSIQLRMVKDEHARSAIRESQSRVYSISLLHKNLYTDVSLGSVSANKYLGQLIRSVHDTFDPERDCTIVTNISDVALPSDTAMNLGLIANEMLTNAFKHAFPENLKDDAKIEVSLLPENGHLYLKVADNGKGLEDKGNSYGMELIQSLVRTIRGELMIENNDGTSFTVKFPAS